MNLFNVIKEVSQADPSYCGQIWRLLGLQASQGGKYVKARKCFRNENGPQLEVSAFQVGISESEYMAGIMHTQCGKLSIQHPRNISTPSDHNVCLRVCVCV
ncbi:uncharacterized protein [Drosophila bipectinata]|uniref:uncharacterized protein n=1 Tax=Drosophila bipectinata TaxID=42026 RepID=UPI0038B3F054